MKNIKLSIFLFLQLFALQAVTAQVQTDENGRLLGTVPQATTQQQEDQPQQSVDPVDAIDDADIPGTYYLQGGGVDDIIIENEGAGNLLERLDNLEAELMQLRLSNEQLALENRTIKKEMGNCCSEVAAGLGTTASFLLQNSPNPFNEATRIQFFIEEDAANAVLEIRNMEGVLIETHKIDQKGLNELHLNKGALSRGAYIYTLTVDGQMIDSKVMIQQ